MYLYSEHGLRAEDLEFLLGVGVVVSLVALERRLLLGQRTRFLVEAGVDDVRALLHTKIRVFVDPFVSLLVASSQADGMDGWCNKHRAETSINPTGKR